MESPGEIRFYSRKNPRYYFLTNFYSSPFELDSYEWKTVEHYFQAMKFVEHPDYFHSVRQCITPSRAKSLGRTRNYPLREDWEEVKEDIMLKALYAKFEQNPLLKDQLLDTGNCILIEDSPTDYYWGIGKRGTGKNRLGHLLMRVRDEI